MPLAGCASSTEFRGRTQGVRNFFSFESCQEIRWSEAAVCLTVYCLLLAIFPMEPPDDLLRHLTSYTYGYDYRRMFFASPGVPAFNMYYLFDTFAGGVHQALGEHFAFLLFQLLGVLLYATALFLLTRGAGSRNLRFVLVMAGLALVLPRTTLARPSTFESGLFLIALALCLEGGARAWVHVLLGTLMASFYYLFFIYLVPLAFFRRMYALPLTVGIAGWCLYGGNDYFRVILDILTMKSRRGIEIAEATPIVYAFLGSAFLLIPVLMYGSRDSRRLLGTGWFLLSNQIRYMEVVVPVLVSVARHCKVRVPPVVVFLAFISLAYTRSFTRPPDSYAVLKNAVPAGSRVLFLDMEAMFKSLYANPGLRVSPCMDPGWDLPQVVQAMKSADKKGALEPAVLAAAPYEYLIEKNLREIPPGLELVRVAGRYRVWKITRPVGAAGSKEPLV